MYGTYDVLREGLCYKPATKVHPRFSSISHTVDRITLHKSARSGSDSMLNPEINPHVEIACSTNVHKL